MTIQLERAREGETDRQTNRQREIERERLRETHTQIVYFSLPHLTLISKLKVKSRWLLKSTDSVQESIKLSS